MLVVAQLFACFPMSRPFVLRLLKEDTLLPYQVLNEVTCISMVFQAALCPNILVPEVYNFDAESPHVSVAQEYVDGEPLSSIYRYNMKEKEHVALDS